eukprot:gene2503-biopygen3517
MPHESPSSSTTNASDQRIAALEAELKALKAAKPQFLPTGVKPPLPTRLSAKRRSDVPDWISNTRVALQLAGFCNLDHSASVAYASTFLDDKANAWWRTCLAAPANPDFQSSGGFGTFDSFAAELQKNLGQPFPEATAREKLAKLQQTKSVLDYSDAFTKITKDLSERHWKYLRFDYLQGLKLSIREMLTGKITEETKWEDIASLAHQCDQVLMARPQYMEHISLPSRHASGPTPMELGHMGHVDTSRKAPATSEETSSTPHVPSPTPKKDTSSMPPDLPKIINLCSAAARNHGHALLVFHGTLEGIPIRILLDSGAQRDFVSRRLVEACQLRTVKRDTLRIRLANGMLQATATELSKVALCMGPHTSTRSFVCTDIQEYDIILGMPWLTEINPNIDFPSCSITSPFHLEANSTVQATPCINLVKVNRMRKALRQPGNRTFLGILRQATNQQQEADPFKPMNTAFSAAKQSKLHSLIARFQPYFAAPTGLNETVPLHRIPLQPGSTPPETGVQGGMFPC